MDAEHITSARLFDAAAAGLKLDNEEKAHLVRCNGCKEVLATFVRQFSGGRGVISQSERKAG